MAQDQVAFLLGGKKGRYLHLSEALTNFSLAASPSLWVLFHFYLVKSLIHNSVSTKLSHQQGQLQRWTMTWLCLTGFLSKETHMDLLFCAHHKKEEHDKMVDHNSRLHRKQKQKAFTGSFTQQPEERRMNPLLARLQDWFVVKQRIHPGVDSAAPQPAPRSGVLVFKHILIPILETRELLGTLPFNW